MNRISRVFLVLLCACAGSGNWSNEDLQKETQRAVQAVKREPENSSHLLRLGRLYLRQDSLIQAARIFDQALNLRRGDTETLFLKGSTLYKMGERGQAIDLFKTVLYSPEHQSFCEEIGRIVGQPFSISRISDGNGDNAFPWPSPSSDEIAFQSNRDGNWEIYRQSLQDGTIQRLTFHNGRDEGPFYLSDGRSLVFTSTRADTQSGYKHGNQRRIFRRNSDATLDMLTPASGDHWSPRVSPSGNTLAYLYLPETDRDDDPNWPQIMAVDLQLPTYPRAVTSTPAQKTLGGFEADGNWIYYSEKQVQGFFCHIISLDGSAEKKGCGLAIETIGINRSAEGRFLVFYNKDKGDYNLFLYDRAAKSTRQLTGWPTAETHPVFSADGTRIFFHAHREGLFQIYAIEIGVPVTRKELLHLLNELDRRLEQEAVSG